MAEVGAYKHYNKRDRRSVLEADFSKGMMSTDGVVTEGYFKSLINCAFEKETSTITPRPGLRVSGVIFPNLNTHESEDFYSDNVVIKGVKQCIENGVTYQQIILCKLDDNDTHIGKLWVLTAKAFIEHTPLEFESDYSGDVMFSDYLLSRDSHTCYFNTAESPIIHDIYFSQDDYRRIEFPVGEFAYGNSYYFFGEDDNGPGLFRTVFDTSILPPRYEVERVNPKELTVSEAVTYGYNMLLGSDAYVFNNGHSAPVMEFEGILPYDPVTGDLMMTPKKNQAIDLVCYYNVVGGKYDIIWESRETTASDWTLQKKETVTFDSNTELKLTNFHPQNKAIMFRVSASKYAGSTVSDIVEKAMVVGFDFSSENYGAAKTLEQKVYNLHTGTGIENWNGRNVIWGLPEDPTIMFISDYDEPSYFPYPNNIVVFNEPIIHCVEFMNSLAVFTTDKLYQVTLSDDGMSFNTVVIQSHLSIDSWDKHLIQTVRNMLFFKSGNYYYMMVPKAQSLTGELTCAPITTPITSFFDRFSVNVQNVLRSTYDYEGEYEFLTYYNFLDYDDVHNIYAYKFDNSQAILHFDVIYNTVDRTWKVWVFEAPNYIYPFRQEATRSGILATTSLVEFVNISEGSLTGTDRILQAFTWDKMLVRSCYIPFGSKLTYDPTNATAYVDLSDHVLHVPDEFATVALHTLRFIDSPIVGVSDHMLHISDSSDFYAGYSKINILKVIKLVYDAQDDYYTFKNYQYIDTGYRDDSLAYKKRYREIQFQINNLDKTNMQFGMEYILDGAPRRVFYKYDVSQAIDEMDENYGVVYIDSTPYLETDLRSIDLTNQWTLDQNLTPEIALWKIRVAVSGKGYAPRFKLFSRNEKRFELLNLNWISKFMHMR